MTIPAPHPRDLAHGPAFTDSRVLDAITSHKEDLTNYHVGIFSGGYHAALSDVRAAMEAYDVKDHNEGCYCFQCKLFYSISVNLEIRVRIEKAGEVGRIAGRKEAERGSWGPIDICHGCEKELILEEPHVVVFLGALYHEGCA